MGITLVGVLLPVNLFEYAYGATNLDFAISSNVKGFIESTYIWMRIENDGDESAHQIKINIIDKDDAFEMKTENKTSGISLDPGEEYAIHYEMFPKQLGGHTVTVQVDWMDSMGDSHSRKLRKFDYTVDFIPPANLKRITWILIIVGASTLAATGGFYFYQRTKNA